MGEHGSAVFVWRDRALFVGDRSTTEVHAHHGVEVSVALGGELRVREEGRAWCAGAGAVVASDARHQIDIAAPKVAILYVEPLSADGQALDEVARPGPRSITPGAEVEVAMSALLRAPVLDNARAACTQLLASAGVAATAPAPLDPRVRDALAYIAGALEDTVRVDAVARAVALSPSRFAHLFRDCVGVSVARYVAWLRLRVALTSAMSGMTMTEAAHVAGFADAAHFTRTCKKTFGLAPSEFAPVDVILVEPGVGHGALARE